MMTTSKRSQKGGFHRESPTVVPITGMTGRAHFRVCSGLTRRQGQEENSDLAENSRRTEVHRGSESAKVVLRERLEPSQIQNRVRRKSEPLCTHRKAGQITVTRPPIPN